MFLYVYQSELIHNVTAHAGEWDLYTNTERVGDQNREIREIVTHKQKTEDRDKNALAIVFLRSAFVLSKYVATICLPPQDYKFVPGENCNSCAWQSDESLFNRHTSNYNFLSNYIVRIWLVLQWKCNVPQMKLRVRTIILYLRYKIKRTDYQKKKRRNTCFYNVIYFLTFHALFSYTNSFSSFLIYVRKLLSHVLVVKLGQKEFKKTRCSTVRLTS